MPEEKKQQVRKTHNIIMENRSTMSISGVQDVDSFDEQTVVLFTEMGTLTIKGDNLHINKLSIDVGEVTLDGDIGLLAYEDDSDTKREGLFARLFK